MVDRFLLEVYCPADAKLYEFWVSKNMSVCEATANIASEIEEFEQNSELFDMGGEGARLYCMDDGRVLPCGGSMLQCGIQSGNRLMIV